MNTRDGVLVLSENAGVHEELAPWALTVNPFDVAGQAEALHEGDHDAGERGGGAGSRASATTFARTTSARWIEGQLSDLDEARTGRTCPARAGSGLP